jgi:hypothetical protein
LWSIANFYLVGRQAMALADPTLDTPERAATVLDFWERCARAYRGNDGTRQAWDTGTATPYAVAFADQLLAGVEPVAGGERDAIKRFNATLVNYLFLLYFDTRAGYGDTGPYAVPGRPEQRLLVRDFYRLSEGDFWWSDVAKAVPYHNITAALVLEHVEVRITDFGTSNHTPENYLDHVVGFALYTPDPRDGSLHLIPRDEYDAIVEAVRAAQRAHYRNIAAMPREEKIRCGAYVYFSFLRAFAHEAGIAEAIDWSVPRDLPAPLVELFSAIEGANVAPDEARAATYYPLFE